MTRLVENMVLKAQRRIPDGNEIGSSRPVDLPSWILITGPTCHQAANPQTLYLQNDLTNILLMFAQFLFASTGQTHFTFHCYYSK
jgi:hypothetical protein